MGRRKTKDCIPCTGPHQKPGKLTRDSRLLGASQHCLTWRPPKALHYLILITPASIKIIDWGDRLNCKQNILGQCNFIRNKTLTHPLSEWWNPLWSHHCLLSFRKQQRKWEEDTSYEKTWTPELSDQPYFDILSLWYPSNLPCHCSPVKCQKLLARGLLLLAIFKAVSKKGNNSITDLYFLPFHTRNLRGNRWKLYLSVEGTTKSTILWRQTEDICLGVTTTLAL